MGHDQFLYLSTFIPGQVSLLDSLEAFVHFLRSKTSWIQAVPRSGDRFYSFMSMYIQGNPEQQFLFRREDEDAEG